LHDIEGVVVKTTDGTQVFRLEDLEVEIKFEDGR